MHGRFGIGLFLAVLAGLFSSAPLPLAAQVGSQDWYTSELSSDVFGSEGTLYRFNVKTEASTGYEAETFAAEALAILADERSWAGLGEARFQLVPGGAASGNRDDDGVEFTLYLASPDTVDLLCAPLRTLGKLSCRNGNRVVENIDRWLQGPAIYHDSFDGELGTYRNYVINHEVGHRIGRGHENIASCRADLYAPVMMQQTFDVRGCAINGWPAYDLLTVGQEPPVGQAPTGPCDPALVFPWSADDRPLDDSVTRLYQAAFGRPPDQAGLNYWIDLRVRGITAVATAELFLRSVEGQLRYGAADNERFIQALYLNVLGRQGDAEGKSYWIGLLDGQTSRAEVLGSFSDSPENVALTGTSEPQSAGHGWVARLYQLVFDRTPDCEGARYWLWAPYTDRVIVDVFIGGEEFQAQYAGTTDPEFLAALYKNVLGRPGDAEGLRYWSDLLAQPNVDRADVVLALLDSYEFRMGTGTE